MGLLTDGWRGDGPSWQKDYGRYLKTVHGPCRYEPGLPPTYILRKMTNPSMWGNRRTYNWGYFDRPEFDENGNWSTNADGSVNYGNFITTSAASEWFWNDCHRNPPTAPEQDPEDTDTTFSTPDNLTSIIENIDWRIALAIVLLVVIGIYALIKFRK